MTQVNARIDKELYGQLRLYSAITQVPVSRCIADAVGKWIERTAVVRLAGEYENIVSRGHHARRTLAEKELAEIVHEERGELGQLLNRQLKLMETARNNSESRQLAAVVEMPGKDIESTTQPQPSK
jgi:hypothetical protein